MTLNNRRLKKLVTLTALIAMIATVIGVWRNEPAAAAVPSGVSIYKMDNAANWDGDYRYLNTIRLTTTISGATGSGVYKDRMIGNEVVQFEARFKPDAENDGWVAFKFRGNDPYKALWDNSQLYAVLVRDNSVELQKWRSGSVEVLAEVKDVRLNDGQFHTVQIGAYDNSSVVNFLFAVDGQALIHYEDKNQPITGSGLMSVNTYGKESSVEITSYPQGADSASGLVGRPASSGVDKSLMNTSLWFVNQVGDMSADQGIYGELIRNSDQISLLGRGAATYKNRVRADAFSFNIAVEDTASKSNHALLLVKKKVRNKASGEASYGVRVSPNGQISLVKYLSNNMKIYPAYETGLDFTKPQNIRIEFVSDEEFEADIYIYVNNEKEAYHYTDDRYLPSYTESGFIGIVNSSFTMKTTVSDLKYEGTGRSYSQDDEVLPVYFADYMEEGGKKFLYWSYRPDFITYSQVIITDTNKKQVGVVDFPNQVFELPANHNYKKLYVTAVSIDGNRSEAIAIDLTDRSDKYYSKTTEHVVIKSVNGKAGFYLKDSNTPFIVNGVNYVGLRGGDHSTFEAATEFTPAAYDPYKAEAMFKVLKKHGYNSVRVFLMGGRHELNPGLAGNAETTAGIYAPYMENVIDFLKRAKKYGIYVITNFGENEMINNDYFKQLSNGASTQGILFSKEGLTAKKKYISYILGYIKSKDESLLDIIMSMSMQNEFAFNGNEAPFNQTSGTYTFLDGTTYDMSNDDSRRKLANMAMKNYYKEMKKAVKAIAPHILLSEGTFTLQGVHKSYEQDKGIRPVTSGDSRYPMTAVEYLQTDIDFLDYHVYRYGTSGTVEEVFMKNFRSMKLNTAAAKQLLKTKPVILGEFGAISSDMEEEELELGMAFSKGLLNSAMKYGASGAMIWTIDTFNQNNVWALMEDNGSYLQEMSLIDPTK